MPSLKYRVYQLSNTLQRWRDSFSYGGPEGGKTGCCIQRLQVLEFEIEVGLVPLLFYLVFFSGIYSVWSWACSVGSYVLSESSYIPCHSTVVWGLPLIWNTTSWVALVAKLVERSPRLLSVEGLNPTQDNSLKRNSCPGWSWLVCCACAFLPSGLYMLISEYSITESSSDQYCCLVSHAVCGYGSSRSLSSVITRKGVAATILHKVDILEVYIPGRRCKNMHLPCENMTVTWKLVGSFFTCTHCPVIWMRDFSIMYLCVCNGWQALHIPYSLLL